MQLSTFLSTFACLSTIVSALDGKCKCTPNDSCWPSPAAWSSLNTTLGGALIRTIPPGSVCYPSEPNYDEAVCTSLRAQWFNSTYHASDPVSIDYPIWTNNSCNPIYPNGTSITGDVNAGMRGCGMGNYPVYVVNVTTAEQISTALKWAAEKNIRIVVKATGHSYLGRSSGYGSLSIWTHHMRGIDYMEDFKPAPCPDDRWCVDKCYANMTFNAVRIRAGHTNIDVQEEMNRHGKAVVTGANPSVGYIGWLTGGGHGPLSSTYGMGAYNLLEATIVTPNGQTYVANPCRNKSLFAAIRGGGGNPFGVITEVIVNTFPTPNTTTHTLLVSSRGPNMTAEFYAFVGFFHADMQRLKEGGIQGYYSIIGPPLIPTEALGWTFLLFDKPYGTVEKLVAPIEVYLNERKDMFTWQSNISHTDMYLEMHRATFPNEAVANIGSAYGSRLLSAESLADPNVTAKVFAEIGPSSDSSTTNSVLIGHMIAPRHQPSYFPEFMSLNHAWRRTLTHLIVISSYPDGAPKSAIDAVYADITHNKTEKLRELSPDTGVYFNEADSYEPEWQIAFWGNTGYSLLKKAKERYDPGNVLWCRRCVGSEALVEQEDGRLCKSEIAYERDEL